MHTTLTPQDHHGLPEQSTSIAGAAPFQNLQRLVFIRSLVLFALIATALYSYWTLQLKLPYHILTGLIAGLAAINLATFWRLIKKWPIAHIEFFVQLLIDLLGIGLLLYFSGGASNPFISYLLVPVCIAAATLPAKPSWIVALSALGIYSFLLFYHIPMPALAPQHDHYASNQSTLNLHILGMWLNFVMSALLVTYFVVDMAKSLRRQEAQLQQHREDGLRDEQLLAVATLAAGTAHELGTPLSTMKILIKEMQQDYQNLTPNNTNDRVSGINGTQILAKNWQQDLNLLSQQVEQCTGTLRHLVSRADQAKQGKAPTKAADVFCRDIIERWLLLNPKVEAKVRYNIKHPNCHVNFHPSIEQSILNLLNNAADANPKNIKINIEIESQYILWKIIDCGPGISPELIEKLGMPFNSTKEKGFGLGLFLSHATINRYGGHIKLNNRDEGGTLTELFLPFHAKNACTNTDRDTDIGPAVTP